MPHVPAAHAAFIERLTESVRSNGRFLGLALAGSYARGEMDEWSDIDAVMVVDAAHWPNVLDERQTFAAGLGNLLSAFTGEHVGEPRLLIAFYSDPLLHVDLKFVDLPSFASGRFDEPVVLWERDGALTAALAAHAYQRPPVDRQWIEDRFWTWVHYQATKIARGELLEAFLTAGWLMQLALGPLVYADLERAPQGVRRLEALAPQHARRLADSVPVGHMAAAYYESLLGMVELYRDLRGPHAAALTLRREAEAAAVAFLDVVGRG